jgi:polyhydroxybutyrate depolymerase
MHLPAKFAASLAIVIATTGGAMACGTDTDCSIGTGAYRIFNADAAVNGALVFAHGYRGTAQGTVRNRALRAVAEEKGIALVALQSLGDDWSIPNVPKQDSSVTRDEPTYLNAVIADLNARFKLNTDRVMLSGFSAGGMCTWQIACNSDVVVAGYAPLSGTLWDPMPDACPTADTSLMHFHGDRDKIVPLGGRPIGQYHQGDVPTALKMYARDGGFDALSPARMMEGADCDVATNAKGKTLSFCQFSAGHSFKADHLRYAWDAFMSEQS